MRFASCEYALAGCLRASRSTTGPDQCFAPLGEVGDLAAPIGHARPGIRARRLIRNTPAAAITLSWIQLQLLRRRVSALTSGARRSRGSHLRCNPAPHSLARRFRRFNQILWCRAASLPDVRRSEEHTSELQSLMRISYAVFCLKKQKN